MSRISRLNVDELPDLTYTRELRAGVDRLRFDEDLERQYRTAHLRRVRWRARIWFTLSSVLSLVFTAAQLRSTGLGSPSFWLHLFVVPWGLLLVWLAWSRHYERLFLPIANIVAPLLGVLVAAFVAVSVARGEGYRMGVLTVDVVAALFFMGLQFRAGMLTALGMLLGFTGTIATFGVMNGVAWSNVLTVGLTALLSTIVKRDVESAYRRSFLESALLAQWVTRDALSGLINRRALDAELGRVWEQAQRDRRTLVLMMIDIDHFKSYNDSHGHQAGDEAIRAVARVLATAARRPLDLAARYGGDEFVLLLYDVSAQLAEETAEALREGIERAITPADAPAQSLMVTASIGVSVISPMQGRTPQNALRLADEALYEAKQGGRNRVVLHGAEPYPLAHTGRFATTAQ
ncbi:MAG TPA: GGDEF domain-containing protein [Steroidobacteraceae bacterium]|jgi:diguanylate cyclase (GGDEF)-like protein|nr:GGDEF domain-containing protein [Steroidobacteraceae bacterium]